MNVVEKTASAFEAAPGFRSGFVAIFGAPNVGKSSLVNALAGKKLSIVSPKAQTTRSRIIAISTNKKRQLIFVDTPGFSGGIPQRQLRKSMRGAITQSSEEADVRVLVLDVHGLVQQSAPLRLPTLQSIKKESLRFGVPQPELILLNKIDLLEKELLLPLLSELGSVFKADDWVPEIVPVSAKTADGIKLVDDILSSLIPEGPPLFPADMRSDQSDEFFISELIREQVYRKLNRELPYQIKVRLDEWVSVSDRRDEIRATILVARDSQKPIVIGKGGNKLKDIGSKARAELEKHFRKSIYLELFVSSGIPNKSE